MGHSWQVWKAELLATRKSNCTRRAYTIAFVQFEDWCRGQGISLLTLECLSPSHIADYRSFLLMKYGTPRPGVGYVQETWTISSKLIPLRSLYSYARRRGEVLRDPTLNVSFPTRVGTPHPALSQETILKLLRYAEEDFKDAQTEASKSKYLTCQARIALREAHIFFAMMTVLAFTGCRISEMLNIRKRDLTQTPFGWRLRLFTKGARVNQVTVTEQVADALLEAPHPMGVRSDLFFVRPNGDSFEGSWFNYRLKALCKRAGVPKFSSHSFRATVATTLHTSGVPLVQIKNLLGHESIETTSKYVRYCENPEHAAGLKISYQPKNNT